LSRASRRRRGNNKHSDSSSVLFCGGSSSSPLRKMIFRGISLPDHAVALASLDISVSTCFRSEFAKFFHLEDSNSAGLSSPIKDHLNSDARSRRRRNYCGFREALEFLEVNISGVIRVCYTHEQRSAVRTPGDTFREISAFIVSSF
jgi:hypothetical protein